MIHFICCIAFNNMHSVTLYVLQMSYNTNTTFTFKCEKYNKVYVLLHKCNI